MTTHNLTQYESNVDRLNAFLDQFPDGCDPDFDAAYDDLNREFAHLRNLNDGGANA